MNTNLKAHLMLLGISKEEMKITLIQINYLKQRNIQTTVDRNRI